MYDENNVFAKIIKKELPAKIVYEDDNVLAFHTIQPKSKVHILVIPKQKFTDYQHFINNQSDEEIASFFKKIDQIAKICKIGSSYKLTTNFGKNAGQEVYHFHFHLMCNFVDGE